MATSMDSTSSAASVWPPLSLTTPDGRTSCEEYCRHAQDLEVAKSSGSNSNDATGVSLQVQMACLLVLGDTAACRHLWRRHRDGTNANNRTALEPWWKIAAAMISHRYAAVWEGLQSLVTTTTTSPSVASLPSAVIQTYASEIADAYRQRLLKALIQQPSSSVEASSSTTAALALPGYYTAVFGFSQPGELQDYYQKSLLEQQLLVGQNESTLAQERSTLTSFLEAQRRPI